MLPTELLWRRLPGYRFHPLKGNRKGAYAVTVRANWRVTFEWEDGSAVRADLEDYHGE
jgi:toxin HigB-1